MEDPQTPNVVQHPKQKARYQMFLEEESANPATPEKRLLAGILQRAIRDIAEKGKMFRVLDLPMTSRYNAAKWVFFDEPNNDNSADPFSFAWCCNQLGFEPNTMRESIKMFLCSGCDDITVPGWYKRRRKKRASK